MDSRRCWACRPTSVHPVTSTDTLSATGKKDNEKKQNKSKAFINPSIYICAGICHCVEGRVSIRMT